MTDGAPEATDWSEPEIWSKGRPMTPRTFTEADPVATASLLVEREPATRTAEDDEVWSPTTYKGARGLRRSRAPAEASTISATPAAARPPEDTPGTTVAHPDGSGEAPSGPAAAEPTGNRSLLANSRAMAVASLISRVTGFLRSSLLVAAIGLFGVGDAYNVANNLPNMVYELLLGGVLSSVLVPVLVRAQEADDDGGIAYTQRLLSIATAALGVMTLLAVVAAPLFAAGFVDDPAQRSLTSIWATLLLPEIFFYGVGAMLMAVLNIRHSYAAGAWSPVLNNVVMIVTLGVFWILPGPTTLTPGSMTNAQVLVLGVGTTLGIALQAIVLVPALRRTGFDWQWRFRARPNEVGRLQAAAKLAGWVLVYVVASQIGVTVIAKVGAAHKAFTIFTNADLLIQMPYGILVVSLLTALMPRMSRAAARDDHAAVVDDFGLAARLSAVALLPVTALLCVLGPSIGVTLFGYGQTSVEGGRLMGTALAASAFGLFPFAIVMLQLRVFYARHDGRTPTMINIAMVGTKVLLVLVGAHLVSGPAHIGETLTVATSASYVVGAVAGHVLLTRQLGSLRLGPVLRTVARTGVAALLGALAALAVLAGAESLLGRGHAGALVALVLGGTLGLAVFVVAAHRLRVDEIRTGVAAAGRLLARRRGHPADTA
ncbi:MAG: murein biosynthesis integral membrane protein MurJ [Jatrophihabitans sp.]|uniref:murein biosynthesis integral membrane protein MurJ n=1 Tax=Jatrophihabitans sp. TaxID=1932789 RepID=UPI003F7DD079